MVFKNDIFILSVIIYKMDFPTTITDIINNVRKTYGITLLNLKNLKSSDEFFLPLFEKDELSRIDIHELNTSPPRIIAFGDIHGDLQALVGILYAAELIDVSGNWIEQRPTYVVQTGDLFDNYRKDDFENSCLKDIENLLDEFIILNYLTHLHKQAQQMNEKSRIVLCIGNHEFINLTGNVNAMNRYVIPKSPLTIDARIELFKPGGVFAIKLSSIFRVIAKIDNYLFMHGGIHDGNIYSLDDIKTYNTNLNEYLNKRAAILRTDILRTEIYEYNTKYSSITWYRKMIDVDEVEYIDFLHKLDPAHKLKVIVGHTITNDDVNVVPVIVTRANGQIILLDTAMSRCWADKLEKPCDLSNTKYNISFIVIENDTITSKNKEALVEKDLKDKLKSTDVQIIKTYNNIKKKHWFRENEYHLALFKYDNKFGIATMNISDHKLRKINIIYNKTKDNFITTEKKVEFKNIKYINTDDVTSFNIIFHSQVDMEDVITKLPVKEGGRKIRSKNNRNRNRTTKYKKNKSIRNKNYRRISRRK